MVNVPADAPTLTIPAPDMLRLFPKVSVVDAAPRVFPAIVPVIVEKLVTDGVVAEIVIDPAPTPTLTIPAPEMFRALLNVPVELLVVFPSADIETEEVLTPLMDTVPPVVLIANPPATE
jgi:hypothetical protein